MGLSSHLGLKEKDIISIVGAGGKTSLMFQLAEDLKRTGGKVLLTTTTKIYAPEEGKYDFICIGENEFAKHAGSNKTGVYIYGTDVNPDHKMSGLNEEQLDKIAAHFDYVLIEADGAKMKQAKGWNDFEPVVYSGTVKTIGVIDIQAVGMRICECNVHRSERFCSITHSKEGEHVTLEHLLSVIVHQQGLFKNAKGEKILFINKADDVYYLNLAEQLRSEVYKWCANDIHKIVIGSIKNNQYYI
ncbi:MAG: hypothetical protein K0Q99_459 [Clostridia bacterium]|jgi:probable selenium-dependent hydroxylase accessory protein YqeC|nr:hypothetical protein [Clostridia bacterium]